MFQSNREYINFLIQSGVHTFLKETPNNLQKNKKNDIEQKEYRVLKKLHEITKINELAHFISSQKSSLKKNSKKLVLFDGNIKSNLMIIGEVPEQNEDGQDIPFVGKSGQLLNKMLSAIQLDRKDVYLTNVIPWRLPEDREPTNEEILEFLPFLQKQVEIVNPSLIYLLGSTATKAILSTPLNMEKLRGKWHQYKLINMNTSINVIVSYDPAFLLRSPHLKKEAWKDLQMLQKKLNEN